MGLSTKTIHMISRGNESMFRLFSDSTSTESAQHASFLQTRGRVFLVMAVVALALAITGGITALSTLAAGRPHLKVNPTFVGIPGDGPNCNGPHGNNWVCHVTISEAVGAQGKLHWTTSSDTPSTTTTTFSPSSGTLSPGQQVRVTITTSFCGGFAHFFFKGPSNTVKVTYQCG
jgi:hypothetical protein